MIFSELTLGLPQWIDDYFEKNGLSAYSNLEDKMRLVVKFAELNVANGIGGPFAAAVFEVETGRLIAPGVNIVMPSNCSSALAEVLALSLAQKAIGSYNLRSGKSSYELVTSTEPCAMCMGANIVTNSSRSHTLDFLKVDNYCMAARLGIIGQP